MAFSCAPTALLLTMTSYVKTLERTLTQVRYVARPVVTTLGTGEDAYWILRNACPCVHVSLPTY